MLSSILIWLFTPVYELKGVNYSQLISPLGFQISLFKSTYILVSPLTILALFFFIFSAILPLIWKSSRYSLYSSTISAGFGIVMIINSFIFDERYLHYYGYSILPTPTGSFYISFPYIAVYGFPFYLFIGASAISALNSATKARWLSFRRLTLLDKLKLDLERGEIIKSLMSLANSFYLDYATIGDSTLKINDLVVTKGDEPKISLLFSSGEKIFFGKNHVLYQDREGELRYYDSLEGLKLAIQKILEKSNFNTGLRKDSNELYN
ncbi:hypothetical protein B6F84_12465 [Acidianus manzaensis]|uniref:Uncharacterized protein n=2 Tax=Acidianus manzaensis TaxID=282676 RepID=A0A1W6K2J8_9CREN|nr:hypothetical protein B6F84_12465 [Acidianus manzaensis]